MTHEDRQNRARSRAVAKYGFYKHLVVFLFVNLLLLLINLLTSPGYIWSIWPLLGWGIAVALHAFRVFGKGDRDKLLDRLIEEEMRRDDPGST